MSEPKRSTPLKLGPDLIPAHRVFKNLHATCPWGLGRRPCCDGPGRSPLGRRRAEATPVWFRTLQKGRAFASSPRAEPGKVA